MSRIIGVEQSLSNIEDALKAQGYEVIQLRNEEDAKNVMLVSLQVRTAMLWELVIQSWQVLSLMRMDFRQTRSFNASKNISTKTTSAVSKSFLTRAALFYILNGLYL